MIRIAVFAMVVLVCGGQVDEAAAGARRSRPLQTGQTKCWDVAGSELLCALTSGQDGLVRRGEPRAYLDNGNGTIKDNRTALTWEKLCDDGTIHDKDNSYTWSQAFERVVALNTVPCFAGVCDWRLPNLFELETLRDMGGVSPAVAAPFRMDCAPGCTVTTCSCTLNEHYWSSTTYEFNPTTAWFVNFSSGYESAIVKTDGYRVRAVRGGS
jgi:hypothetical protein